MKLQNLTVIFVIIILPIILMTSLYITTGIKTIKYQSLYDTGLLTATHDAIYAFEINTANNDYSDNAETKRNILKSSVKAFEKSLCNTCGISSYNTDDIEEYIPAIVFGMYDGFYMYAPSKSYNSQTGKTEYSHSLKNYVYYSETLDDGTVIIYSLDNYVTVSGYFDGEYKMKSGYLIDLNGSEDDGKRYKNIAIDTNDISAIKYYKEAYHFTDWFLNEAQIQNKKKEGQIVSYLNINSLNDPEDENSPFVQHKREIIKNNIESVLNSSITAYSERILGQTYKMPKLSVDDWDKIYNNISMITFFQGKSIGLTKYNGYCVLNSTNSNEYVNPNLMYFIDQDMYHDIRCKKIAESIDLKGYKVGSFEKRKVETPKKDSAGNTIKDEQGNIEYEYTYEYRHKELADYDCINDSLQTDKTVYQYVESSTSEIKTAYWTSLARERYDTIKLTKVGEKDTYTITFKDGDNVLEKHTLEYGEIIEKPEDPIKKGHTFMGWDPDIPLAMPDYNLTLNAKWNINTYTITFKDGNDVLQEDTYEYGKAINVPDDPTKDGYIFRGWDTDIPSTMPDYNLTINATWQEATARIGNKYYTTLQSAIDDLTSSDKTIELLKDVTENITIGTNKKGTIDLNGHKVEGKIKNSSTTGITIKNGTITTGSNYIDNYGKITISGTTITAGGSYSVYNNSGGEVTIENSTIKNRIYNSGNGKITISGTTITGGASGHSVYNNSSGEITIEDSTITTGMLYSVYNGSTGKVTIRNSTIKNTSDGYTIHNKSGSIEIIGTDITTSNSTSRYNKSIYNESGTVIIKDSEINHTTTKKGITNPDNFTIHNISGNIEINGTKITTNGVGSVYNEETNGKVIINNGSTITHMNELKLNESTYATILNYGNIEISGYNTIIEAIGYYTIQNNYGATLTINSGKIKNNSATRSPIYVKRGSTLIRNGGEISHHSNVSAIYYE